MISKATVLNDLPVLDRGCDSSYSHRPDFMKFRIVEAIDTIADKIKALVPVSNREILTGLSLTGGEPMMQQRNISYLLKTLYEKGVIFHHINIETNCTQELTEWLTDDVFGIEFSMSPKLFTVAGERDAFKADIINSYYEDPAFSNPQLKFVVRNHRECWEELDTHLNTLYALNDGTRSIPITIMPVGGTEEQQCTDDVRAIATETLRRGWHFSARVQNLVWGNAIGK